MVTEAFLLSLARQQLSERDYAGLLLDLEGESVPPPCFCSCSLPEGWRGSGGWHFATLGRVELYGYMQRRFAAERPGWPRADLRREWEEWIDTEETAGRMGDGTTAPVGVHLTWLPYLGTELAMEPCPRYRAAVRGEKDTGKATQSRRDLYA